MNARLLVTSWLLWSVGAIAMLPSTVAQLAWSETGTARVSLLAQTMGFVAIGLVGLLLARRCPDNAIGWLFLGSWAYYGLFSALTLAAQLEQQLDDGYTGHTVATWMVNWTWVPLFGCVILYPLLLFPNGRTVSTRWQPLVPVGAGVVALWTASFALQPAQYSDAFGHSVAGGNPYGIRPLAPLFNALPSALAVLLTSLVFAALWSLVLRYRRGGVVERAQLKWFLLAGLFWLPVLLYPGDHGNGGLIDVWLGVALAAIPVAMGMAILRYRLYDIDRILSRTASYAIVTGLLLSTYAVSVTAATRLLPSSSTLAVAGATLAAAALARPLLRKVQVAVDRRFNRSRYDALRTLEEFGEQLRGKADVEQVSVLLLGAVTTSLEPRTVRLDLERSP